MRHIPYWILLRQLWTPSLLNDHVHWCLSLSSPTFVIASMDVNHFYEDVREYTRDSSYIFGQTSVSSWTSIVTSKDAHKFYIDVFFSFAGRPPKHQSVDVNHSLYGNSNKEPLVSHHVFTKFHNHEPKRPSLSSLTSISVASMDVHRFLYRRLYSVAWWTCV